MIECETCGKKVLKAIPLTDGIEVEETPPKLYCLRCFLEIYADEIEVNPRKRFELEQRFSIEARRASDFKM